MARVLLIDPERKLTVNIPRVSVLLPTNVLTPWLDDAVESVLSQEDADFELVVIHDGIQPDATRTWVHDPRVRCVVNPESDGLANALNVGAQHARGEYIARIDGDDKCLPGRIAAQVQALDSNATVVLLGTLARVIDESGDVRGSLGVLRPEDIRTTFLTRNALVHSSVMFRRAIFDKVGRYNASLRQMEDYDLWLRMAPHGEIRVIQKELVEYRVHSNQMSRGAGAFGTHIRAVLHGRRRLAGTLGQGAPLQFARNLAWWCAQVARHRGWRSPGYLR